MQLYGLIKIAGTPEGRIPLAPLILLCRILLDEEEKGCFGVSEDIFTYKYILSILIFVVTILFIYFFFLGQ